MKQGRPLRFLALVLGGWVTARAMVLWPGEPVAAAAQDRPAVSPFSQRQTLSPLVSRPEHSFAAPPAQHGRNQSGRVHTAQGDLDAPAPAGPGLSLGRGEVHANVVAQRLDPVPDAGDVADRTSVGPIGTMPGPTRPVIAVDRQPPTLARLRGDTWLIARGGGSGDNLAFGQLGASQAGARLTYALDGAHRLALSARLSSPLRGRGREGALGIDWQPTRLPIHLLAEQRLPLGDGRGRPAVQLIAGAQTRLPLGLALDGYAQAGAVKGRGGFADGAAHLVRPLATGGAATLDAGAGGWGAVQRSASRVDVGPTIGLSVPIQGAFVRLAVDYRFRVAGDARPGSGPALSVGTGF